VNPWGVKVSQEELVPQDEDGKILELPDMVKEERERKRRGIRAIHKNLKRKN